MVPFDRSHTTSYSPSKATICLSHAVSEIWGDEKNCVDSDNKKLIAMTTSLEGSKKIISDRSPTAKVLPTLQLS